MLKYETLIENLNSAEKERRLPALSELAELYESGKLIKPAPTDNVNNHIHTTFSFSPYSPAKAVYMAWLNGLTTAGIMDHDSIAGAGEFIKAGEILGMATTVGAELRCELSGTPFEGRRLNNPDQNSVAYLAMHGIPHGALGRVQNFMAPYRAAREARSREMTGRLDGLFAPHGIRLDFDRDVAAISLYRQGGTITERHILFALAGKLMATHGAGGGLVDFLEGAFSIEITGGLREKLTSPGTPYYQYHLLGLLKSSFMDRFYIDARDELVHVSDFVKLADEAGAIAAYAYLGDVKDSVTGDKKDSAYEDSFLDELTAWLKLAGFHAVTYMPARNTPEQLARIIALCGRHALFQISGEDINSPFQSFICPALADPRYAHLVESTWALIGHEKAATRDPGRGMFSPRTIAETPPLSERIKRFATIGRSGE